MRSVECARAAAARRASPLAPLVALALSAAALGGCAAFEPPQRESLPPAQYAPREEPVPGAAAPVPKSLPAPSQPSAAAPAAPAAPAAAAAPALAAATAALPPVDAAAQRAFDDALRALRAGRADEAGRGLKALAQAHPELGGVHANLALLHRRAGRDAEAVAEIEQAVKLSPQQPLFFNQLGIAYRQTGQFAKARAAYETAIALDAGYAAPQLNLAILLDLYLGDRNRAAEWYQRSAVLLPGEAAQIDKWLTDLKNRKAEASLAAAATVAARKEME